MPKVKYRSAIVKQILYIRFNAPIHQQFRDMFRKIGVTYDKKLHHWISVDNHKEAIDIAEAACEYANDENGRESGIRSTLCWKCKNSVLGNDSPCPWAKDFTPVDGWKAEPTYERRTSYLKNADVSEPISYHIIECPLFIPD